MVSASRDVFGDDVPLEPHPDAGRAADPAPGRWSGDGVGRQLALAAKSSRSFFEQLLAEAGASFGMWSVLAVLHQSGPLIQRELAARLSIEGPTLTRHLSQMESRGLIVRRRSDRDRRATLVGLTASGREMNERLTEVAHECYSRVMRGFTLEELDALHRMLTRVHRNAQTAAARGSAAADP